MSDDEIEDVYADEAAEPDNPPTDGLDAVPDGDEDLHPAQLRARGLGVRG